MYGLNRYKDGSIPKGYADDLEDDDRGRPTENPQAKILKITLLEKID